MDRPSRIAYCHRIQQGGEQCAFVDITESTLDLALQNDSLHHYEVLDLEQDEILFELGDPVDACYVLLSGELCGTPTTREGTYDSKWKHIITSSSVVGVMSFMTEVHIDFSDRANIN